MTLDRALEIVNDPSLNAYCDYTHNCLYRELGEFDFGFDETYDEIAFAFGFIAVEAALDEELFEYVPNDARSTRETEAGD